MNIITVSLSFVFFPLICLAQDAGYPVPPSTKNQLFYLQHSRNKNTVLYDLNLKDGKPDPERPVNSYWIRYSEKGQKQELNPFQRNFAFGLSSKMLNSESFQLNFVSKKQFKIVLQECSNGTYCAYTTINKRKAILTNIFVNISGGSALSPEIDYVIIRGINAETNEVISERVQIR